MNIIRKTTNPLITTIKFIKEFDNKPISVIYENFAFPDTNFCYNLTKPCR